jgi:predicted dehydrogenase
MGKGCGPGFVLAERSIRVGVVGLGSFGRHHVRHYAANPRCTLVAVADVDAARRAAAVAASGATACADYRDLIGEVDAVAVTVPATLHHEVASTFLDRGIHVFVEKPIATDSPAARDLVARAQRAGVLLQVGHIERYSPAVDELRARVTNPRRISALRRAQWHGRAVDVDVVLDMMIHDVDLVLTLAKAPLKSVAASGQVLHSGLVDEAEAWLTFEDGLIATLSASRVAETLERKLTVTEPGTQFSADLSVPSLSILARGVPDAEPQSLVLPQRDNLGAEIEAFLTAIGTGIAPEVDGRAGVAALEVCERIALAMREGAAPRQMEPVT